MNKFYETSTCNNCHIFSNIHPEGVVCSNCRSGNMYRVHKIKKPNELATMDWIAIITWIIIFYLWV
jgi:ssDNA-binding Zn-finger/Zn-ribbon topoisomerase 1